jgi:hypothetical protein
MTFAQELTPYVSRRQCKVALLLSRASDTNGSSKCVSPIKSREIPFRSKSRESTVGSYCPTIKGCS